MIKYYIGTNSRVILYVWSIHSWQMTSFDWQPATWVQATNKKLTPACFSSQVVRDENFICCPPKSQSLAQRSNRARPRRADASDCDRSLRGEFTRPPLARVLLCVGLFLGWPFHTPVFIYRGRGAVGWRDLSESLNTIRHAHALAFSEALTHFLHRTSKHTSDTC